MIVSKARTSVTSAIASAFVMGCDVPGYLEVHNKTDEVVRYVAYPDLSEGATDTVALEVPPRDVRGIMFAFGEHWTDERIREYIARVERIEVKEPSGTVTLRGEGELFAYYRARRRGLFKQGVVIKVE